MSVADEPDDAETHGYYDVATADWARQWPVEDLVGAYAGHLGAMIYIGSTQVIDSDIGDRIRQVDLHIRTGHGLRLRLFSRSCNCGAHCGPAGRVVEPAGRAVEFRIRTASVSILATLHSAADGSLWRQDPARADTIPGARPGPAGRCGRGERAAAADAAA